ncbi:MAG: branched-chain amino acid ABC transporter permease [Xanthobacteraceae bacterium]
MTAMLTPRNAIVALLIAFLLVLPVYAGVTDNTFMVTLFTRIVILAIAAVSLNLIMGFGGMVSFGHAAYLGIGGYAVGILAKEGVDSGFIQWPLALALSALFALGVGALSLRTRGVYFIMITLAFTQVLYYVANGLDRYGGDDGLTIQTRSQFDSLSVALQAPCVWVATALQDLSARLGFPVTPDPTPELTCREVMSLNDKTAFYYLCLMFLLATVYVVWRIVNSRFGLAIQGARSNDRRMQAIGFPTFRYKLICFVIAGVICGLAGVLLANHTNFISPALMHWTRSGDLIVMAVLGGMGTVFGPVFGAVAFLLLEEVLPPLIKPLADLFTLLTGIDASHAHEYWQLVLGPLFLLVVLFARGGIDGLLTRERRD